MPSAPERRRRCGRTADQRGGCAGAADQRHRSAVRRKAQQVALLQKDLPRLRSARRNVGTEPPRLIGGATAAGRGHRRQRAEHQTLRSRAAVIPSVVIGARVARSLYRLVMSIARYATLPRFHPLLQGKIDRSVDAAQLVSCPAAPAWRVPQAAAGRSWWQRSRARPARRCWRRSSTGTPPRCRSARAPR